VAAGMDMFDCVIPTRNARHGLLYVRRRSVSLRGRFWTELRISNAAYRTDRRPLDSACACPTCRGPSAMSRHRVLDIEMSSGPNGGYARAYLHHLFRIGDAAAATLATLHNVRFFMELMEDIRRGIRSGTL
ncbi:MAG: tRNA-guanine transglycosylase, partial [Candidatus Kerfeldbacteria bacterium]|nr:tRNA-guanine transglycosylase [Candidatus Kerfeldbacteria bacterium]